MSEPFRGFPDVVRLLVEDLAALAGGQDRTGGQTPDDFTGRLPFVRVMRVGGGSDLVDDRPILDVDVFDSTYSAAIVLAERIRQYLVGPPPPIFALDKVRCEAGPRELPWADSNIRRLSCTYTAVARRIVIA